MKGRSIILIICLTVAGVLGCNNKETEDSRKQREVQVQDQRAQQTIRKLAEAHNAVVNWRQGFASKGPVGRIYSAEIAPILIRPDGRPILFIADVLDVSSTGKDYTCSFEADANVIRSIKLVLTCTPEQASQIMQGPEGKYAIVALVKSLSSAVPRPDEGDNKKDQAWFPAYGDCLGELNLGNYYIDDLMEILSLPEKKNDQ